MLRLTLVLIRTLFLGRLKGVYLAATNPLIGVGRLGLKRLKSKLVSSPSRSIIYTTLLLIFTNHAKANPRTCEWTLMCSNTTTSSHDLSAFVKNYIKALSLLSSPLSSQGFANHVEGNGNSSTIYTFAECMKDLSAEDCEICVNQMLIKIEACNAVKIGTRSGRLYLGGCFIRFDDHIFQNETTNLEDQVICGANNHSSENFRDMVEHLLLNLSVEATESGGFYMGSSEKNGVSAFGLAQCWGYLNNNECKSCLRNSAVSKAMTCLPKTEGTVLNAGCYLKYSTLKFYNEANKVTSKGCQNIPMQGISYPALLSTLGGLIFSML